MKLKRHQYAFFGIHVLGQYFDSTETLSSYNGLYRAPRVEITNFLAQELRFTQLPG